MIAYFLAFSLCAGAVLWLLYFSKTFSILYLKRQICLAILSIQLYRHSIHMKPTSNSWCEIRHTSFRFSRIAKHHFTPPATSRYTESIFRPTAPYLPPSALQIRLLWCRRLGAICLPVSFLGLFLTILLFLLVGLLVLITCSSQNPPIFFLSTFITNRSFAKFPVWNVWIIYLSNIYSTFLTFKTRHFYISWLLVHSLNPSSPNFRTYAYQSNQNHLYICISSAWHLPPTSKPDAVCTNM